MRGFECKFGVIKKGKFLKADGYHCWAPMKRAPCKEEKELYIFSFQEPEIPYQGIQKLVEIVNKITPCELVEVDDVEYIKYTKLDNYKRDLVILNFIRAAWNEKKGITSSEKFIEGLINPTKKYRDPMRMLTYAYKESILVKQSHYHLFDHSNFHPEIQVISVKQFMNRPSESQNTLLL
jgi:hypothetical protein